MTTCKPIKYVLNLAKLQGNTILGISNSELSREVIWMNKELPSSLRTKIQTELPTLKYERTQELPHNGATEFFACNECKVLIVFPLKTPR